MEPLQAQLEQARAELKAHIASWEYAYAMGSSRHGGSEHPTHWLARARTDDLRNRCRDLEARLADQNRRATEGD